MTLNPRTAALMSAVLLLAGCTALLDEGEFVISSEAGPDAAPPGGGSSSGTASSSGSGDGAGGPIEGGVCAPGQTQCAGDVPQSCIDGRWASAGAPCGGASPFCLQGACKPCSPGSRECQGLDVNECSVAGEWVSTDACNYLCDAGVCSGVCTPGATQCNGTETETCSSGAAWQFSSQCMYACVNGSCAGVCVPGMAQCSPSGTALEVCDSAGAWQTTMCLDACDEGECVTGCVPGQTQCDGPSTPKLCDGTGTWVSQTACAQPTPDCQSGACTCLQTTCGSDCIDTSSDPDNCGGCSNGCEGQPCSGGVCQPMALATAQDQPWGIALGSSNCYWTNRDNGTVMTVAAAGTGTPSPVASSQSSPTSIATDTMNVYWVDTTNGGSVLECALGGCTTPTPLAAGQASPWGIAVPTSGGEVYFTAGAAAWAISLEDGGVSALGSESGTPNAIVTDGSSVYWSDATGAVYQCALPGGCTTPTQLSAPAGQPSLGIAVDSANVYFTLGGGTTPGAVWKVPKGGTGAATLMTTANSPVGIAVDPSTSFVYWTDAGDGTVMKMSTGDAGAPVTLASAQSNPTGIVLDSTYVYWTNAVASGSVMRALK
jgi:hypothetical protein